MILSFSGKKQTGKSTSARLINEETNEQYLETSFAEPIKRILSMLTGCTLEQLEDNDFKNSLMPDCWELWKVDYADYGGNEDGSRLFSSKDEAELFISDYNGFTRLSHHTPTYREALQSIGTNLFRNKFHPNTWINATMNNINKNGNVIITDVRFPNEADAINNAGGIIIRLEKETGLKDEHESETALDNYDCFDYIVDNNGTLEELKEQLRFIIKGE